MTSIRTKLLLWLMFPLTITAAIVSIETFYSSRKISNDLSDRTLLAASLTILENVISSDGSLLAGATLDTLTENLGDKFFYHVSGPNRAFVTGYSLYPKYPGIADLEVGMPFYFDGIHQGVPVRAVQLRYDLTGRQLNGITTITTWQRVTKRSELTLSLFARSLMRLSMLVLAAGAIVWFAVAVGLRPLTGLQSAIEKRTPHDLNPIKRMMPTELRGIVNSMNELFERVARSKRNRERFIGDAAHQLRNPVAAIKVQAEAALDAKSKKDVLSSLQQILQVSDHSTGMINKMLSGASARSLDRDQEETHDLVPMAEEVTLQAAPRAFDKGQEISFSKPQQTQLLFQGNLVLLREAFSNLVDNAIHHNKSGTAIEVGLERNHEWIELYVADTGPIFSQEEFITLTQPFLTRDESSSGSGLGLSIAKDIARAHGGYLETRPERTGGKRISIFLPSQ